MPNQQLSKMNFKDYQSAILWSIWKNKLNSLKQLLKSYDPNKITFVPALSVAKMLNRKECIALLEQHKAHKSFAKLYDILKSYCLFFDHNQKIKVNSTLANNKTISHTIDNSVAYLSYGIKLINEGLHSFYSKTSLPKDKNYKLIQDMLIFSSINYFHYRMFNKNSFVKRVISGKTTLVNSGWIGDPSHLISIIFHHHHLIVGDGLKNKIAIYPINPHSIKEQDLDALLSCPKGSAKHHKLIQKVVGNRKPLYAPDTKTQGLNCGIFSPLSALQGLWFLQFLEKGSSPTVAADFAKRQRHDFNHFMKQRILTQVKHHPEAKHLLADVLGKRERKKQIIKEENSSKIRTAILCGLGLAISSVLSIGLMTGVFVSQFALMGLVFGFTTGALLAILATRFFAISDKTIKYHFMPDHDKPHDLFTKAKRMQADYLHLWPMTASPLPQFKIKNGGGCKKDSAKIGANANYSYSNPTP